MDNRLRKILSGLSVAGLIMAGSLPAMGGELSSDTATDLVPDKTMLKDNRGKNDCKGKAIKEPAVKDNIGKGECRTDGKTTLKDNIGKGGCGSTKKSISE